MVVRRQKVGGIIIGLRVERKKKGGMGNKGAARECGLFFAGEALCLPLTIGLE